MGNFFSHTVTFDPATDLVDLKGKVVIVTGGNAGIGYATVQHLSRAGAKVYLGARNEGRARAALAKLKREGLEAHWLKLDLSDPRFAKTTAEDFMKREKRLDVIVHNAGVVNMKHVIGPDGVAMLAIVNYISHVALTEALLPLLKETAKEPDSDVRIVNVSSVGHKMLPSSVKLDDIQDFNITFNYTQTLMPGFLRYAHTKFMTTLWTRTLQRRLNEDPASPITVLCAHPGLIDTFSVNWPFPQFSTWLVGLVMTQPTVGSYNSVFAAAGKEVKEHRERYQAVYLEPTAKIAEPHKAVLSEALGDSLWNTTEAFLRSIGV